ncbi:MAG: hypothetical protein Q7N50_08165, partial [Armatimonadota bacterium]|nr:hypothetical protein [Armatimonadota bacterium]
MNNSHWSKFNGSKKITSESGAALVIALMVLFVVAGLSFAYIALTTNSLVRVDRQERNMVASALAEAGLDYVMDQEKSLPGGFISKSYDLNSVLSGLMSGATGSATITPISGSMAKIRATAVYRNESESVEIVAQTSSAGPWEAAIFAGVGQSGGGINGNVKVAGSVVILGDGESYTDTNGNGVRDAGEPYVDIDADGAYDPPLTSSDTAMALGGTAGVQNNYAGMPIELSSRIPALGTVTYGGETVQSLNAKVHVKRGGVSLSGSGTIGSENQTGNTIKETVDGVYVTDGVTGSGVNSDNGSSNPYDLADDATFPYLSDPYTDTATG